MYHMIPWTLYNMHTTRRRVARCRRITTMLCRRSLTENRVCYTYSFWMRSTPCFYEASERSRWNLFRPSCDYCSVFLRSSGYLAMAARIDINSRKLYFYWVPLTFNAGECLNLADSEEASHWRRCANIMCATSSSVHALRMKCEKKRKERKEACCAGLFERRHISFERLLGQRALYNLTHFQLRARTHTYTHTLLSTC